MGASDHFIRLPFLLEGIFFGLVGALVSFTLVGAAYIWVHEFLQQTLSFFPVSLDTTYILRLLLTLTLFGIAIWRLGELPLCSPVPDGLVSLAVFLVFSITMYPRLSLRLLNTT